MSKKIKIKINNQIIECIEDQTILEVAQENGIDIPALCYHSDLSVKANCRMCLVEIEGRDGLHTSCSTKVEEGMKVITDSPKIGRARKINLELVFAQHREECNDCVWNFNCQLLKLAKKHQVKIARFSDRKNDFPVYQFGPSLIFDSSKCIDCGNCVEVCKKQQANFLETEERGHLYRVVPTQDKNKDCIYCGQCIVHCPVGAFEAVGEFEDIEEPIKQENKIVVFQIAPSLRTSIGEEFGLPYGEVVTEKLVAGIKKLGVDKVFDTSVGADFTTFEEAKELIEKLEAGCGPCLSSCCPAWVKFVEFNYPEFISCLATTRSPQSILGGLIKTYWAQKEGLNPKDIVVVSVMPCVAKKYEIQKEELKIDGMKPVDYVLTTRELAHLFVKHKIDLVGIEPKEADAPLGIPSGAGVIYGASGGVVESALRTAYAMMTKDNPPEVEFKKVRGMEGLKKAEIMMNGRTVRIAVANGIENAKIILEELKRDPRKYDAVEVMACFGGCIGGGGQPVPADAKIRQKRAESLYQIDAKNQNRLAHENPVVKQVYKEFLTTDEIIRKICHTSYSKKEREVKV
ncbi:[FeFe] hydrogenase, group A [Patescibacteria group bacterium]|nr:[FeFe] hydrogenase, group A [Patescibacteria group bacterium]